MALPARSVDDRTYDQLLAVLLKQLPVAEWRDHNPSDPGITLVELLAWLGEMTLYMMNRTTPADRERYLDLVIDPPEPATVPITFKVTPTRVPGQPDLTVPAGTRIATDFQAGKRVVYELIADAVLGTPTVAGSSDPQAATATAREFWEIKDEVLGVSNGQPDQVFPLRGRGDGEVLLDFVNVYGPPGPNPRLTVDGASWELRPFLRTDATRMAMSYSQTDFTSVTQTAGTIVAAAGSFVQKEFRAGDTIQIDVTGGPAANNHRNLHVTSVTATALGVAETLVPDATPRTSFTITLVARGFFMVDALTNQIRLGDDVFGAIPPIDSVVVCTRYQVMRGPKALVPQGALQHLLVLPTALGLAAGETLDIKHPDAEGAGGVYAAPEDRVRLGLQAYGRRDRLVTAADFEIAVMEDFNDFQREFGLSATLIGRAVAVLNRVPPDLVTSVGHITLIVVPEVTWDDLVDESRSVAAKQALIDVPDALQKKLLRFLDRRRLITTHLEVMPARVVPIALEATVVAATGRSLNAVRDAVLTALRAFFNAKTGHFDSRGWPLGRSVYPAEIYRQLESVDGVDYVNTLLVNGGTGVVGLGGADLPVLQQTVIGVTGP